MEKVQIRLERNTRLSKVNSLNRKRILGRRN